MSCLAMEKLDITEEGIEKKTEQDCVMSISFGVIFLFSFLFPFFFFFFFSDYVLGKIPLNTLRRIGIYFS